MHELEVNESHVIKYRDDETVTVTPIDANHCPGAAMFLFEGHFGRILYTGDFRYAGPMLYDTTLDSLCGSNVDVLYLDNTFCDPRCVFPPREDAVVEMLRIIKSHPDARIKIGLRSLGKEVILVALARGTDEWIGVSKERFDILEMLHFANVFKFSSSCRIQVVMTSEITVRSMTNWNQQQETIAMIPTGLGVTLPCHTFPQRDDVHVVPYSDHSSYEELQQFVSLIKPRKIYPILGPNMKDRVARSLPNRADMSCFQVHVRDADQLPIESSSLDATSERQASANSSYSIGVDDSATETTRSKTTKKDKQKNFTFRKKEQMGVVFTSSQSPVKRAENVGEQPTVIAADSTCINTEHNEGDCEPNSLLPPKVTCLDPVVCDTTSDRSTKEEQQCEQTQQQDSVRFPVGDKSFVNTDNTAAVRQVASAVNLASLDSEWMLQLLQPLISQEADKIISERQ